MATLQCRSSKCTAERKGCRRELDSWRHKLIQCVDCEPEEVDDWSPELSCSHCSFCNLPLDKQSDQVPIATSPLSSSSDYSPCQAPTVTESSQLAHRFLQAVFNKKDVSLGNDANIPLVAQELMKKMIHQFAKEYASKHIPHTTTNGVHTRTSSRLSDMSDAPLDLTVSRIQDAEDKEPQSDGVLDLSNRNSSCPAASSSNHSTSGFPQSRLTEELGAPERKRTKCCRNTALDAVLSSLCPAHRSLLCQILKLAHQEKLLSVSHHRAVGQTESHCFHCGVNSQDVVPPHLSTFCDCNAENSSPYYPVIDHHGHNTIMYHPGDSKSKCQIHHYPLNECRRETPHDSNCCCIQRCKVESCPIICSKRLNCISCQTLSASQIKNVMCSFAPSPPLSECASVHSSSSALCPCSLISVNKHNHYSFSSCSNHACLSQVRGTAENGKGEMDPFCPVLKRELSPSPPPLSPIPSDISSKADEMPPSLYHRRQGEGADVHIQDSVIKGSHQKVELDTVTEEMKKCRPSENGQEEQNNSGSLLQDVVNRFSEKLETIKPLEKDPPLTSPAIFIAEKEQPQSLSNSHTLPFHADANLTKIITTVLHTGNDSDYNLSELFHRHNSKEPKSPNTRARRRQEVLAAMATPVDNASVRRHNLQVKREFAVLDQSNSWRKVPPLKRARMKTGNVRAPISSTSSDDNLIKQAAKKQTVSLESSERERFCERPVNMLSSGNNSDKVKKELQVVIVKEEVSKMTSKGRNWEMVHEGKDNLPSGSKMHNPDLQSKLCNPGSNYEDEQNRSSKNPEETKHRSDGGRFRTGNHNHSCVGESQKITPHCQTDHSTESRRSRRNIVPPQRFSSYVTEPRKMYFAACFSESIFIQQTQKENDSASSNFNVFSKNSDVTTQDDSRIEPPLSLPEHKGEFTESTCRGHSEIACKDSTDESKGSPQTVDTSVKSPKKKKHTYNGTHGSDGTSKRYGRLRSSLNKLQDEEKTTNSTVLDITISSKSATSTEDPPMAPVQYKSPIKLMFVSPVIDKAGVRYSLKTAGSDSSTQTEPFDPCEESSWMGTPEKIKVQSTKCEKLRVRSTSSLKSNTSPASSPRKNASSPTKSASSPCKNTSSPPKSASSPCKNASSPTKSASSPCKSASPPTKSASSPCKNTSSPPKSASSPCKSASPPNQICFFTMQKQWFPNQICPPSPHKNTGSPTQILPFHHAKNAGSPPKSASSPRKNAGSPLKSASSPKSATSPCQPVASTPKQAPSQYKTTTSPRRPVASPPKSGASLCSSTSTSPN
ncbi:uncharacterized protein lcorl isoform X2 [Thalassophryne amazonica]|uniref:uncharacterized protein lcorl isoform X2 n=1 Tax=Thalassophryne amazonica TaxID=390379 RepID=UPI001472131D|nr:uncharacterized protein lcorl isoform X2 [Thalassophryne amazonica]